MRQILIIIFTLSITISYGQEKLSKKERKVIADSIMAEGVKLHNYEKSTWKSTDLVEENNGLLSQVGGYLTYEKDEYFKTVYFDQNYENVIADISYSEKFKKPEYESYDKRPVTKDEKRLTWVKDKIIENALNDSLPIIIPEKTNLNLILFPENDDFKLYVLTGPIEGNVVPFGNDYLIRAKPNGEIIEFTKFHTQYLPMELPDNYKSMGIKGGMHSHIETTPFITATDICNFMLYGELYGMKEYSIVGRYPAKLNIKKRTLVINNEGDFNFD